MVAFEWWSFEISAIVVGTINETELAINTVLIQYGVILYLVSQHSIEKFMVYERANVLDTSKKCQLDP